MKTLPTKPPANPRRYVRSFYGDKWRGIVLRSVLEPGYKVTGPRRLVILVTHINRERVTRRTVWSIGERWTVNIKPYDVSWVKKDWWKAN